MVEESPDVECFSQKRPGDNAEKGCQKANSHFSKVTMVSLVNWYISR